ncbi:MAG: O-antigen ligase family protein [Patescibacteria group bacterium]
MRKTITKITEILLYLFVFLLPVQTRWLFNDNMLNGSFWEYGSYSLYGFDILLIALFILTLFISKKSNLKLNQFSLALLFFLTVCFFSLYWAIDKELAFYYFARIFLSSLILYFVILNIKFRPLYIGVALMSAGIIQSILAIYQFMAQKIVASKWLGMAFHAPYILGDQVIEYDVGRVLRSYGTLPHPNILAGFLGVAIIISFGVYLSTNKNWIKYFSIASITINSAGLFFTFSRSAWLGLFISIFFFGLLVFWIYHKRELTFIKLITALILPFILLSIIYPQLIFTRFTVEERLEQQSITERADYTAQSFELIKNYWPTGIGIGNYTLAIHDKIDDKLKTWEYQPVHNIFLLAFAELGVFGLIFYIFLTITVLKNIDLKNNLKISFGICFIFFAIISLFDHYFWTIGSGLFIFFLLYILNANFYQKKL